MDLPNPPGRATTGASRVALLASAALLLAAGVAGAQDGGAPADDTQARIERLERELHELKGRLPAQAPDPEAVKKVVDEKLKEKDEADKKKKEEDRKKEEEEKKRKEEEKKSAGSVVGDDLKLPVRWDDGGFRYQSEDEAFRLHVGGRLMVDGVWWDESPQLRQPAAQPAGSPLGHLTGVGSGLGDLVDGFFIRRARFVADGQIWRTVEFKTEFDFETYNSIAFDESYVGARDLPLIDTVRIGQTHVPFGLEAYTSSRFLPQLERSPLFDAFYQEFAPGVFTDTTFLDQRVTMQHMFHRIDNFSQFNGASFGDGKYAYSGRLSALPVYEDDGRCLLHLGAAYQWRKGAIPADFNGGTTLTGLPGFVIADNTDLVRFRSRAGLRDATGLQGDPARVVDTGNIIADDVQSVNGELLLYWGPAWVQSEAVLAHVDNAVFPASAAAARRGDLNYYGAYVQAGYFLTGDNRGYDRRFGKYDRVRPLENFFLVRDEQGCAQYGLGAWELTYRYAFINLNDDGVQGGHYGEHTVGLNWYWNSNIKIQANYINGQRTVPSPAKSGNVQGFGLRAALEF